MASDVCSLCTYLVFCVNILMISAWSHKEYEMSSDQVCSRMGRRELPITFEHPALVRDGGRLFSDWPGIRKYDCRWKVEGKKDGKGVTAVAQRVRLRRASEKDCTDYIQFKRESRVDRTPRICGSVLFGILLEHNDTFPPPNPDSETALTESVDPKNDWANLAAPGTIIDIDGEVLTYVHVAQRKLMRGDKIEMVIAYTAFQECREKVPEGSFHCGYGLCISSTLVKDGVINCPFADCIDEGSCQEARESNITKMILTKTISERRGGANATSSSFAALFILVIICLGIYYLYRRYRKSKQIPGEVYGAVNGMTQQQALGTGYIEIPGSASTQPYIGVADLSAQQSIILPYPLDPSQLQTVDGQYTIQQPIAAYAIQPQGVEYATQPNPSGSPIRGREGTPPPIGFVVAEVTPIPTSQGTPSHVMQVTAIHKVQGSPKSPAHVSQGSPKRTPTHGSPGNAKVGNVSTINGGTQGTVTEGAPSAPPTMPPPPPPRPETVEVPLQPPPLPPRDAQPSPVVPSAPPMPTP